MTIVPLFVNKAQPVYVKCRGCGELVVDSEAFADLDGEPFINYYCKPCVDQLKEEDSCT